jgi:hypothetical protein
MELGGTFGFSADTFGAGPNGITTVNFSDAQTADLVSFASHVAVLSTIVAGKLFSEINVNSYNVGLDALTSTLLSRGYYVPPSQSVSWDSGVVTTGLSPTWDSIASLAASANSVTIGGSDPGTTLENLSAVFDDSDLTAGGLVHVPVSSQSVTTGTSLLVIPNNETYVFDPSSGRLYTMSANLDGTKGGALIIDTSTPGTTGFPTFDSGTYQSISYNSSTNTIGVTLQDLNGDALGTLFINETSGSGSFVSTDGATLTSVPAISNLHITAPALATETTVQQLLGYLTSADATYTTIGPIDNANSTFLYPSGIPSSGTTINLSTASDNTIVLSQAEFNDLTSITGSGTIVAATDGTFNLNDSPAGSTQHINLAATDWQGTTLTGNNAAGEVLTASLLGNDTLTAGNGAGDELIAGEGVDTLTGGTGGDNTFIALSGLAAGSAVTGHGSDTLIASGDISGATISGVATLALNGSGVTPYAVTLTPAQLSAITTVDTNVVGGVEGLINLAGGGSVNITGIAFTNPSGPSVDNAVFINVADNSNTTVTRSDTTSTTGPLVYLEASGNGNNTLTLGGANGDAITATGTGSNALTAGNGDNDILTASNGTDTLTAGSGSGDQLTATTGGNTLIAGSGAGDFFTAQGGGNTMEAGNGGATFTLYDDDNTATATGGSNTFDLMGASGDTATGQTIDLAGSTINGGTGGTNTIDVETGEATLILSDDDGNISHIQSITGMQTLDINADQMTGLTSLSFDSSGTLNAESAGTYNLAALDTTDNVTMNDDSASGGVTLIGNNASHETLTTNNSNDTLTAGSGSHDTIEAFGSGNTITAGSGSNDTIEAFGVDATVTASGNSANVTLITGSATLSGNNDSVSVVAPGETVALSGTGETVSDVASGGNTFVVGGGTSDAGASISGKNDFYKFVSNFGTDTVTISGGSAPTGHILFGSGITDQSLWFTQSGNNLVIALIGTSETVTVHNWFSGSGDRADDVILSNGYQLTNAQVAGLVTAMASYQSANPSFNPASASTLPSDTTLQAAVTTAWATEVSITDTAANIGTELDYLQSLAAAGQLASITVSNPGTPIPVSPTQLTSDAGALALISGSYSLDVEGVTVAQAATIAAESHVASVSVYDSAANVSGGLDGLETLAAAGKLGSIALTDPTSPVPVITLTEAQLTSDATALADISGTYGLGVTNVAAADAATIAAEAHVTSVSVSDTAGNVTTHIAALETLATAGSLASIALTGTPTLTLSAATAAANADALSLLTGTFTLAVSDSAANVAANIDALGTLAAEGVLTAVAFTDSGTPTLSITGTQAQNDSAIFSVITTPFSVTLTSDTVASFTSSGDTVSLSGSDNVVTLAGASSHVSDSGTGTDNTLTLSGGSDTATVNDSGDAATLAGTSESATVYAGSASAAISGTSDTVTVAGAGSTASVSGSSDTVNATGNDDVLSDTSAASGNTFNLNGNYETATLAGASETATTSGADEAVTLSGSSDTVTDAGAGHSSFTVSGTDSTAAVGSYDSTVSITGSNSSATLTGSSDSGNVSGNNDTLTLNGPIESATVTGSNATVNDNGGPVTVSGATDAVTLGGDYSSATLSGTGDTATVTGFADQVTIDETDGTVTLTGASTYCTVTLNDPGATVTDNGTNNTVVANSTPADATSGTGGTIWDWGNSDTFTLGGNNAYAFLFGSDSTASVSGTDAGIQLAGNDESATLSGTGETVTLDGYHETGTLTGADDTSKDYGVENTVSLSGTGDAGKVYGTGETVTVSGADSSIDLAGDDQTGSLSGGGGTVTIDGSSNKVSLTSGAADAAVTFADDGTGILKLDTAASFAGTVAGLAGDNSIDLGDFLFSGSPTISGVTGTGAIGTATTITITDGSVSTHLALINQFANQYAVSSSAYTLAADGIGGSAGTFFELAPGH